MLVLEYIWVDSHDNIRTKTRILEHLHDKNDSYFDGIISEEHYETDVILKANKVIKSPFLDNSYILLCDTWIYNNENTLSQHVSNKRNICFNHLKKINSININFELFQSFYIFKKSTGKPMTEIFNTEYNNYYSVFENKIIKELIEKCIFSELNITNIYSEKGCDQWTISVKSDNIDAADQLILLRYFLMKVCDKYDTYPNFDPIPYHGYNPSSLRVSFCSELMEMGYDKIQDCLKFFAKNHDDDLHYYGDNNKRLTSDQKCHFSFGISKGNVSVTIPKETFLNKKGNIIDNRPASNADPYYIIIAISANVNKK